MHCCGVRHFPAFCPCLASFFNGRGVSIETHVAYILTRVAFCGVFYFRLCRSETSGVYPIEEGIGIIQMSSLFFFSPLHVFLFCSFSVPSLCPVLKWTGFRVSEWALKCITLYLRFLVCWASLAGLVRGCTIIVHLVS